METAYIPSDSNQSPVIVFALTGKIGSGVSFVRDKLNHELSTYGYSTELVDVSENVLIENYAQYSNEKNISDLKLLPKAERAMELQRRGDLLRERGGEDFIPKCIFSDFIYQDLVNKKGIDEKKAYIIDSLKNPSEADFLRNVFGDAFYLVGVVADESIRKSRLRERKNFSEELFDQISARDEGESQDSYGQHTIETLVKSDYFFENNFSTKGEIAKEAERFLRLIFRNGLDTPRKDEEGMNLAFQVSLKSGCLSRQVGASIYSGDGEVLATGHNDVPRFSGGLYGSDESADKRCWVFGAKCYNDNEKTRIIDEIVGLVEPDFDEELKKVGNCKGKKEIKKAVRDVLSKSLNNSRVRRLLEFSRSIHAEMEAILSVARKGVSGLKGSTLYCTTYPCHNCAKHIVGAGIVRLVYLEPYEKSLARHLHSDSITDASKEIKENKLQLDSYKGVAPRRYDQFFSSFCVDRKKDGIFIDNDRIRTSLLPIGVQSKTEFTARLQAVHDELKKGEEI
jgi:deoxycytidylate deaminase